ncbi:MAG: hypothetical protein ACAF41_07285 [Leptolyngbya sp. BL-A-14]
MSNQPTTAQAVSCCDICQRLTNFYIPIYLVRLDKRINQLVILAEDEIKILIDQNGEWEYQR